MNNCRPSVTAEVTLLSTADGGRRIEPVLTPRYMPHIVIQSPDVRRALVDEDGVGREPYLGICFLDAPQAI